MSENTGEGSAFNAAVSTETPTDFVDADLAAEKELELRALQALVTREEEHLNSAIIAVFEAKAQDPADPDLVTSAQLKVQKFEQKVADARAALDSYR